MSKTEINVNIPDFATCHTSYVFLVKVFIMLPLSWYYWNESIKSSVCIYMLFSVSDMRYTYTGLVSAQKDTLYGIIYYIAYSGRSEIAIRIFPSGNSETWLVGSTGETLKSPIEIRRMFNFLQVECVSFLSVLCSSIHSRAFRC